MKASSEAPDFYRIIRNEVAKAIENPENRDEGVINWNFVDADVYARICPTASCRRLFYRLFDEACDSLIAEIA